MTIRELHELMQEFKAEFRDFKNNDFQHLKVKIDWLFAIGIASLLTLVANLLNKLLP